jgi:hypothetical protein
MSNPIGRPPLPKEKRSQRFNQLRAPAPLFFAVKQEADRVDAPLPAWRLQAYREKIARDARKPTKVKKSGQDSGMALVGVECYFCDREAVGWTGCPGVCIEFDGNRYLGPYGMSWKHARPVVLGRPE